MHRDGKATENSRPKISRELILDFLQLGVSVEDCGGTFIEVLYPMGDPRDLFKSPVPPRITRNTRFRVSL